MISNKDLIRLHWIRVLLAVIYDTCAYPVISWKNGWCEKGPWQKGLLLIGENPEMLISCIVAVQWPVGLIMHTQYHTISTVLYIAYIYYMILSLPGMMNFSLCVFVCVYFTLFLSTSEYQQMPGYEIECKSKKGRSLHWLICESISYCWS